MPFKYEVMHLVEDRPDIAPEMCLGVIARAIGDNPDRHPLAREFVLSVDEDSAMVECQRYDGKVAFMRVKFDGEQLIVESQGISGASNGQVQV